MATEITIPDIGTTVSFVTVVRWLKNEGDTVARGEYLCEIETDKAVSDLESIAQGTLLKILVEEGSEVEQGAVIAYVGEVGETVPQSEKENMVIPKEEKKTSQPVESTAGGLRVSPVIRNMAAKQGVDLSQITGTGPGGRITRDDVLNAKKKTIDTIPLSTNQVVVARNVLHSHHEIPPINLQANIDMTTALKLRQNLEEKSGCKISIDAFFIKAVATVMQSFLHFRCRLEGENIAESKETRVGIAIAVNHDLYTPTIRNVVTKSIPEIDDEIRSLAKKAKQGTFALDELGGATLTVSNLGMFPVNSFDAIIPLGQIAALAIGAIQDTAVVQNGRVKIVPISIITLSVDHRLINGLEAGEFISHLKKVMEEL